ncbi:MAG: cytochrome c [Flavobacteriaceae bacterium]|nr:cytochrome c [Flavobacteriaceae bacterium]
MKRLIPVIVLSFVLFGFLNINLQQDRWIAPEEAKSVKNPVKSIDKGLSAKRGKRIFKTRCMICHGVNGVGNGPGGKALSPKPQNLTLPMVQKQTDGEIFWKVSNGRNAMIKWGPILSENERWDVVNYVRTLDN